MKQLQTCISEQIDVNTKHLDTIVQKFSNRTIKKGDYLLKAGSLCREMAFIESGYLRVFNIVDGKEVTLWIGGEGKFITSLSSFVFQTPNYWNIQAVTETNLLVIKREDHFDLCKEEPKWLEFDNLLLAHSFALLEKRMFMHLHTTSQQRFDSLLAENPQIFNHVPLQYIASMLGITAETLSRLRKNISISTS